MRRPPMPGDAFDDNFDGTSDRRAARVTTRIAHAVRWLLPVAIVFRVATYFDYDSVPAGIADAVFTIALVVAFFVASFHQNAARLCVRCMEEVPANAAEIAERRRWALWFHHRHDLRPLSSFGLLVGVLAVGIIGGAKFGGTFFGEVVCYIPNDVFLFSLIYSVWIHHRLRPWCPYCRGWDDDGPAELVPDPDPADSKKIPR